MAQHAARVQDVYLLAELDETRPVLTACEGLAPHVISILKEVEAGGELLSLVRVSRVLGFYSRIGDQG